VSEKKSNGPMIAIVAVIALFVLGVPCILAVVFLAGIFSYRGLQVPVPVPPAAPPVMVAPEEAPVPVEVPGGSSAQALRAR